MLAKKYEESKHDVEGWLMSEKLDGVRAIWDGEKFMSRNEKPFFAPQWFKDLMPPLFLDGELWIARGTGMLQKTVSAVRKKVPVDSEWKEVRYIVFDAPTSTQAFTFRIAQLSTVVVENPHINVLPHKFIISRSHMMKEFSNIVAGGGEGLVVRNPNSEYEEKRSGNMLKLKTMHMPGFIKTEDGIVIGHTEGEGKYIGMVGALIVEWEGGEVKVGSGLTDADRHSTMTIPVGSKIIFKYEVLTGDGVPFHPIFLGVRDYE
jgi:DNA ligase-1